MNLLHPKTRATGDPTLFMRTLNRQTFQQGVLTQFCTRGNGCFLVFRVVFGYAGGGEGVRESGIACCFGVAGR